MHLVGTHLPGGRTIAACGEPVLLGRYTWSLEQVSCEGCLESSVYGQMHPGAR